MKWQDLPLRRKISRSFIALYTVLLLAITLIANLVYRNLMDTQLRERALYEERLMVQQLEKFVDNVNSCNNNVILNLNLGFRQYPGAPEFQGQSLYEVERMLLGGIQNSIFLFSEASRISVVLRNGAVYTRDRTNQRDSIGTNLPLYEFFDEETVGTEGRWFYGLEESFGKEAGRISYVKSLRDTQTNLGVGYVVVCVGADSLQALYRNPHAASDSFYGVFSRDGRRLTPGEGDTELELVALRAVSEQTVPVLSPQILQGYAGRYYLSMNPLGRHGEWVLVSAIDRRAAMQGANLITASILVVGLCIMLAANIVIAVIARRISGPLQQMAGHMVHFRHSLPDELPPYPSRDEIGVLTENFNRMIRRNGELLTHIVEEQRQKQHYELALLQSQIKPHFLYNTLDTAYCLAGDGQERDARRILKLLADYYRTVLNRGDEWITVARETESVTKYMEIQKMRYGGLFRYEVDVPADILQMKIPKLTLQPLVENAIYHGLKPLGTGGVVRIDGELQEDWAIIRVADNGVGLSGQQFRNLLDGGGESRSDSFGVKNIQDRLRLFYGERSGLALEPTACGGATMVIRIFLGLEGEDDV